MAVPAPRKAPPIPLRIFRPRDRASTLLDNDFPEVPFEAWDNFAEKHAFNVGEHITLIGKTKSGKTTLAVNALLPLFPYVLALGTTEDDPALYRPLKRHGFVKTSSVKLDGKQPRQLFVPKVHGLADAIRKQQAEEFRLLLSVAFAEGRWAIYPDELPYLTRVLGLAPEIETLFLQGSKKRITMIVATQEPVNVPREAFGQIIHLFIWKLNDQDRIDRVSEIAALDKRFMRSLIPRLADHEALYVNVASGELKRTIYEL